MLHFVKVHHLFNYPIIFNSMDISHFVIHLSVEGHLSYFHFWATMKNAAMNIHVWVFVWTIMFSFLLGRYLGVELLGHVVILCLTFFFKWELCIYLFIYLFLAVLGLRFCVRAFSSCGKWGPLFIAVRGPLTIAASPVAEHRLQTHRLSNCGSRA